MKVVLFNGSPKAEGNTGIALGRMKSQLEEAGMDVELVHVGNKTIKGCVACSMCVKTRNERCVIETDPVNDWIQAMKKADGIVLASPVYFSGINGTMKSFLDRAFYVSGMNGNLFKHKVGTSIAVVRRTGGMPTVNGLNHYLQYSEMIQPTSMYWNVFHGTKPGDVLQDEEGMQTLEVLTENMISLLQAQVPMINAISRRKKATSFIR